MCLVVYFVFNQPIWKSHVLKKKTTTWATLLWSGYSVYRIFEVPPERHVARPLIKVKWFGLVPKIPQLFIFIRMNADQVVIHWRASRPVQTEFYDVQTNELRARVHQDWQIADNHLQMDPPWSHERTSWVLTLQTLVVLCQPEGSESCGTLILWLIMLMYRTISIWFQISRFVSSPLQK